MKAKRKDVIWICLALSLSLNANPAAAASAQTSSAAALAQLENKYFQHTYPADLDEKRVARLERFVFGTERTGTLTNRMADLTSAAGGADAAPAPAPASDNSGSAPVQDSAPQTTTTYTDTDAPDPDTKYSSYPRVTELEQEFLGKTYEHDLLPARVARLEVKKFGKVGTGDICDRLDKLDQYAKPKPVPLSQDESSDTGYGANQSNYAANQSNYAANQSNYAANQSNYGANQSAEATSVATGGSSSADNGGYPRVTQLEKAALGTSYTGEPLQARICRLETKEFGKVSSSDDMADRIDKLEKKIRPANPVAEAGVDGGTNDSGGTGNGSGRRGGGFAKALAMVGNALGGGMGMGMGPGMGMMMPGMGMGMGPGMGMMMGRGGMGMGGMGMGRMRGAQTAQSPANDPPAPAVAQNPFASDAAPIVGLENRTEAIERFVLGKAYSDKPLEERVQRLEKKLVPYEHNNANGDLTKRVNHLWSMLAAANSKKDVAAR